ncbi:MAG: alginate lyase family protein [Hyphomicrobiaceae bacterium]
MADRGRSTLAGLALAGAFGSAIVSHAAAASCPAPPAPVRDIAIPRYYSDKAGTRIDPVLKARHQDAAAPLKAFLQTVARDADRSLKLRRPQDREEAAQCAIAWLETWARGEALLGRMANPQSEYERKWDLAGIALAYLKLKSFATDTQRRVIEAWLDQVATEARRFFEDKNRKRNNQWYWLGVALGATALATGNEAHWREARSIMADAAGDIRPDGALPMELARGRQALHYHVFSAMALVMLAELGAVRGEDWYGLGNGALHRLIGLTVKGYAEDGVFERLTGEAQDTHAGAGSGWFPLYERRHADRLRGRLPPILRRMNRGHRWIGGDAMLLFNALQGLRISPASR